VKAKILGLVTYPLIALAFYTTTAMTTPDWLAGKPDLTVHPEHCAVYRWILSEADKQTGGLASQEALAKNRIINLANKLVKYHNTSPQDFYKAEIKYLVTGGKDPLHFDFRMEAAELNRLLEEQCDAAI
jgi:hypothetical protein